MGESDARLHGRAASALRANHTARLIVLAGVVSVVVLDTVTSAIAGYYLALDDLDRWRTWLLVATALGSVINMIFVVLAWLLLETITRVEREADRLQAFMDNMYRRRGLV